MAASLSCPSVAGLLAEVEQYYTRKVDTHGATPLGVDWSCVPTQQMRFVQLLKLCAFDSPVTLNDIGCGYGALLAFMAQRYREKAVDYLGVDLSPAMLTHARRLWRKRPNTEFIIGSGSQRTADYSIASGIFNVKLGQPEALWIRFIEETLTGMHHTSRLGFAANFLAPLAEGVTVQPELYRSPSAFWVRYCEEKFGASVEVLENYGMREYTLLVRNTQPTAFSG